MRTQVRGFLPVLYFTTCIAAQTRGSTTSTSLLSVVTPSTCPFRSINYITQSLPQQCLTSSWASKPSLSTSDGGSQSNIRIESSTQISRTATSSLPPNIPRQDQASAHVEANTVQSASTTTERSQSSEAPTPRPEVAAQQERSNAHLQETDADSPLDNANFLSFEEWKRRNLAKAGQSAENFAIREGSGGAEQRRRPGGIHNALDSLGEESEIDIDFGGFVNPGRINEAMPQRVISADGSVTANIDSGTGDSKGDFTNTRKRSKDAGKTFKERSNYASFDCAATVMKTNPRCKGSTSILVENKDSYMLNVCSVENKFFIVELCDDILIDTVVLANFEFFSSMFRAFRVSVSDRYPVKTDKWKDLGTFEARNSREIQAFLIQNPLIWARYLRIEFLSQYGKEYYCPISLLRVHGTTMMEEFNHEVKGSRNEDEAEGESGDEEIEPPMTSAKVVIEKAPDSIIVQQVKQHAPSTAASMSPTTITNTDSILVNSTSSDTASSTGVEKSNLQAAKPSSSTADNEIFPQSKANDQQCALSYHNSPIMSTTTFSASTYLNTSTRAQTAVNPPTDQSTPQTLQSSQTSTHSSLKPLESTKNAVPTTIVSTGIQNAAPSSSSVSRDSSTASASRVHSSSATQPHAPNPTTQESFFKSVHKRLQQLEANSTLSLQYIEEQSRILRDAFSKVEKRQLTKASTFLETLNTTVLTELREFRMQYDQIWQSTVLELSSQREQSQNEVLALSKRLNFLADEIILQKRIAILQFMLLVLCLGFVIFNRHSPGSNYFELPLLAQSAVNKSSPARFDTPPTSPSSTRPSSRYDLFRRFTHRRSPSEESDTPGDSKSPSFEFSPPTPESLHSLTHQDDSSSVEESRSPGDSSPVRRTTTSKRIQKSPQQGSHDHENSADSPQLTPTAHASWSAEVQNRRRHG